MGKEIRYSINGNGSNKSFGNPKSRFLYAKRNEINHWRHVAILLLLMGSSIGFNPMSK